MKFGIALPNFGKFAEKGIILDLSIAAEELGFDSVWVSDHIIIPKSHKGFGDVFYEPITTLSFIANKTSKIKLGTSVIILPYRNPIAFAKQISTLDCLSDGRVILGVGAGWLKKEFDALGIPHEKRGLITDEYIEIIKELSTNNDPKFKGKYHKFSDIKFYPKPIQKPYPPFWVGGNSNKAIQRAVKLGNGWHAVGLTPTEIKEKTDGIETLLLKENKQADNFVISVRNNLQITDNKVDDQKEILRGKTEKIIKGIKDYRESDITHLIFQVLSGNLEGIFKTMETFSKDIKTELT